jgi:putative DNA methylase
MSSPRRHLPIDDQFDSDFANQLAQYETYNKHHYRPNTYLHKWWGRRCGSTFRLILKGLAVTPDASTYYEPGGLEGWVILDPMMGGGTTLHEALRLGANVVGVDVDPIPVLQARASLTVTDRGRLEAGFRTFFDQVQARVEPCFITGCPSCDQKVPIRHVLYGRRHRCRCREVLVVDALVIRREADGTVLRFCPQCGAVVRNGQHDCPRAAELPRLVERHEPACVACGGAFEEAIDSPYYARYSMIAVAGRCPTHCLFYKAPDATDQHLWQSAEARRPDFDGRRSAFAVEQGEKSYQLVRRGIDNYLDLYSSRQLLFLEAVLDCLPADDPALRLDLALLVSTSLEFNSMLSGYKGSQTRRAGAVRHTFSHHAYAFPYTALENNPVYPKRSSGTLQKLFYGRLLRGREWAEAPRERVFNGTPGEFCVIEGELDSGREVAVADDLAAGARRFLLRQTSAAALPLPAASVDAVVTDPPYYDSIQYDDLAAYFRVWLQQMVPDAADWSGGADPIDTSGDDEGRTYALRMGEIFGEARRVLRPERGRLIFTFHHWRPEAWASLTYALQTAGFRLINRYVVHAEHPMSVHINNMRALTHDVILVLAPERQDGEADEWPAVAHVARGDSQAFCQSCGSLLGYLLQSGLLTYEASLGAWRDALQMP